MITLTRKNVTRLSMCRKVDDHMNTSNINQIYFTQKSAEMDTILLLCEYYMKEWTMQNYYLEGSVTAQPEQPPAQPAQQPPPQQNPSSPPTGNGTVNVNSVQLNQNSINKLIELLTKLIEILTNSTKQFVEKQANQVAMQQNEQAENEIEQLKEQAPQKGVNINNEQTVNELVEELAKPDEEDKEGLNEQEKRLTKCVLIGNFQDCMILAPQNIQVMTQCNETLKNLIDTIKSRGQDPNKLAESITNELNVTINDKMLAQIEGNSTADNLASASSTTQQLNWKQFRENEKNAFNQLNIASKQLNVIEQSFKTGGIGQWFRNIAKADLRAQTISKPAMEKLQRAIGLVRKTMGVIMRDIQSIRKVNAKLIRKLRTICVGGNNSRMAFADRSGTQKAGVQAQWIGKEDKNRFQSFQGTNLGNNLPT